MKSETVSPLTPTQKAIAALADEMVANNPDAADELAKHLASKAGQAKRLRTFGIGIRFNAVKGSLELQIG